MNAHPGSSIWSCVTLGKSHNLSGSWKSHLKRVPTSMAGPASRKCRLVYPTKVGLALLTTFYFYCRLIFPFFDKCEAVDGFQISANCLLPTISK